jgi:hypothetical protein
MKSPVTIWPNVAPGTGFFAAETAAPIRSNAPAGTERPQAESKKARQSRDQVASLHKATDSQTGWWWMQSDSNPSPPSNSLLTGKLTGNFAKFSISARIQGPGHEQIQWLAAKFPTHRTGNYFRRNREFWLRNRESFFPDQIQIISAQPDRNRHRWPAWTRPRERRAGARANHGS